MNKKKPKPPFFAKCLGKLIFPKDDNYFLSGDFKEIYFHIFETEGRFAAWRWFWFQILLSIPHFISDSFFWRIGMFKNNIKFAFRNIKKYKGFSFINIIGLAAGMACCIITFLYVESESTYDKFNMNADRIYRVAEYRKVPSGEFRNAKISPVIAKILKNDFPQVEHITRIMPLSDGLIKFDNRDFYEDRIVYADQEVFDVFTIPFIFGDPATALIKPRTVVLTEKIALKYFGKENPVGKIIQIKDPVWEYRGFYAPFPAICDYLVTGVAKNSPSNSHFKYDLILSLKIHEGGYLLNEWHASATYIYLKLAPGTKAEDFEKQVSNIAYKYIGKRLDSWGQKRSYFLQPLVNIHYHSNLIGEMEPPGNKLYVYIYSVIGFLILLIGCMNFINLSNARSICRIKEVGLRKIIGAGRWQLIKQLMCETFIIIFVALVFAFILLKILLPLFNDLAGTELTYYRLYQPPILLSLAGLVFVVGILAGGYSAYILTTFKPEQMIQGVSHKSSRGSFLLRALVIGQFVITIFFIIGTVTVYQQLHFMKGGTLGFSKEQKYVIPFRMNKTIRNNYKTLKNEFLKHHFVIGSTVSSGFPGSPIGNNSLKLTKDIREKPFRLKYISIDYDFIPEYKIEMAAGRPFSEDKNDAKNSILINEEAVLFLGYHSPQEALEKRWCLGSADGAHVYRKIVGVTKNFHYQGMQNHVEPLFMDFDRYEFSFITLSLSTNHFQEAVNNIEKTWNKLASSVPCEGFFLNDNFDQQYHTEEQVGKLLGIITCIGLFITCLGLFGLAMFVTRQRIKEISIRKVHGASVLQIITLFSKNVVFHVLLAGAIASPLAYYAAQKWLQGFAYRINFQWTILILAAGTALLIAMFSVSFQIIRASMANPVNCLRDE